MQDIIDANIVLTEEVKSVTLERSLNKIDKTYGVYDVLYEQAPVYIGVAEKSLDVKNVIVLRPFYENKESSRIIDINESYAQEGQAVCVFRDVQDFSRNMNSLAVYPIKKELMAPLYTELNNNEYNDKFEIQAVPRIEIIKKYADTTRCEEILEEYDLEIVQVQLDSLEDTVDSTQYIVVNKGLKIDSNLTKEGWIELTRREITPLELWEHSEGHIVELEEKLSSDLIQHRYHKKQLADLARNRQSPGR